MMMMATTIFFEKLFEYNHWANQSLIKCINEQPALVSELSLKWMSHILNAQHIWNSRISKQEQFYTVWQVHSPVLFMQMDTYNQAQTIKMLKTTHIQATVRYNNSQNKSFANSVQDILFHVINHSTYHRGQIASDLKRRGITPPVTDFIAFKR